MPSKYVILNLRKWRRVLVCIKKARKTNKQIICLMRLKDVSHNLKLGIQVQKPFMNAKLQSFIVLSIAFLRDLLF